MTASCSITVRLGNSPYDMTNGTHSSANVPSRMHCHAWIATRGFLVSSALSASAGLHTRSGVFAIVQFVSLGDEACRVRYHHPLPVLNFSLSPAEEMASHHTGRASTASIAARADVAVERVDDGGFEETKSSEPTGEASLGEVEDPGKRDGDKTPLGGMYKSGAGVFHMDTDELDGYADAEIRGSRYAEDTVVGEVACVESAQASPVDDDPLLSPGPGVRTPGGRASALSTREGRGISNTNEATSFYGQNMVDRAKSGVLYTPASRSGTEELEAAQEARRRRATGGATENEEDVDLPDAPKSDTEQIGDENDQLEQLRIRGMGQSSSAPAPAAEEGVSPAFTACSGVRSTGDSDSEGGNYPPWNPSSPCESGSEASLGFNLDGRSARRSRSGSSGCDSSADGGG